jgi:hypothetical protein
LSRQIGVGEWPVSIFVVWICFLELTEIRFLEELFDDTYFPLGEAFFLFKDKYCYPSVSFFYFEIFESMSLMPINSRPGFSF